MNDVVIVQDPAGFGNRVRALQRAHPRVYPVTPWDRPNRHCTSIRPHENWLPTDPSMSYGKKCWWKADAMGWTAVKQLNLRADFYWFIESDVVATQERWRAMFADFAKDQTDLVAPFPRERSMRPDLKVWHLPTTPAWADRFILMACFRISRRALVECMRHAEAMRDCFSEVTIPSVVARAGFTIAGLNVRQTHCNTQTFGPCAPCLVKNPKLLNHPEKSNTFDVPA